MMIIHPRAIISYMVPIWGNVIYRCGRMTDCSLTRSPQLSAEQTMATCQPLTKANIRQFLDSVDNILTDCDGVLWNGTEPISGSADAIHLLKKLGKRVYYVTNNSTKSRNQYVKKCQDMGFPASEEDIIGSGYVTAQYLKTVVKDYGHVYVIGSEGLAQELEAAGIPHLGIGPDDTPMTNLKDMLTVEQDPKVKCVVVGFDPYFNYAKLFKAASYLQNGSHFVATNTDSVLPLGAGRFIPGTGAIVVSVETAAERKATVCGKPHRPIFDMAMQKHNLDPSRTVMIGDRLNTDIELAHNCGLQSLLVLTGYSMLEDAWQKQKDKSAASQRQVPHYYVPALADIVKLMES